MKQRFLKLNNGKSYFIHTLDKLYTDEYLTDYSSYVDREEVIDGYSLDIENGYLGYIINGNYTGLTGTYKDPNGNTYTLIHQSSGVLVSVNGVTATFTDNAVICFCINGYQNKFGIAAIPTGPDGTILYTHTDSLTHDVVTAEGNTNNQSSYNDWMSSYGSDVPQIHLCIYKDEHVKINQKYPESLLYQYLGITVYYEGSVSLAGVSLDDIRLDRSVEDNDDDPYADDDPSGDGGGDGNQDNWDDGSDDNGVPPLPSISATDTGFISLYNPTVAQLQALADYMWAGLFDIDAWKKIMADPMDAIIGLSIVPVSVAGGTRNVTVGNIPTGIALNRATAQFVEINCGTIAIDEKWKCYLDYSPYTKVSIYLPYIGAQELDIDMIQGTTLGVVYHVDVLSGACVAFITEDNRVIAQFSGQCATSIPITSQNFTQTIMALGSLVASGIGVVASGGLSAPVSAAGIAGAATAIANTAATVASSKPTFAKSGNMSGSNGLMGCQTPYIIIERPRKCAPARQNEYTGYPSYVTRSLGSISGFTQVQDIHLDNISCTDAEREEILSELRKGVIL